MDSSSIDELATLKAELQVLKLENEKLRTEKEITMLQNEMSRRPVTSTPAADSGISIPDLQREMVSSTPRGAKDEPMTPGIMPTPIRESAARDSHGLRVSFDEDTLVKKRFKTQQDEPKDAEGHRRKGTVIKPATYDGTGSWIDFKAHFDACATINEWTEKEKGLYLAVSLRGQAQGVFGNLASKANDYIELVRALQERFQPPNQTDLYRVQLRERRQKAKEKLSELAQDIRRLTNLAYPTAPNDLQETLAKEQFIDSLYSSEIRIRTKQARPQNLNDAVRHAIEFEAYEKAERKRLEETGNVLQAESKGSMVKTEGDLQSLKTALDDLREEFKNFTKQSQAEQRPSRSENSHQQSGFRGSHRSRGRFRGNFYRAQRGRSYQNYRQGSAGQSQSSARNTQSQKTTDPKQSHEKTVNRDSIYFCLYIET